VVCIRYVVDEHGDALGTVGFGRSENGFEVFYALRPETRGRGLVTAAVTALTGWLAGQGETVVWLNTLDGNAASEAVAVRCGFRRFRSGTHVDGRPLTVWTRAPAVTADS
jgi:RimJ/RimL family protein N-acetyltransferase